MTGKILKYSCMTGKILKYSCMTGKILKDSCNDREETSSKELEGVRYGFKCVPFTILTDRSGFSIAEIWNEPF